MPKEIDIKCKACGTSWTPPRLGCPKCQDATAPLPSEPGPTTNEVLKPTNISNCAEPVKGPEGLSLEEEAKEVDAWLDLLELDHRDIIAKQQYKFPQEAGREYRNKCNLLGAVLASIRKKAALRAKGDWVGE